MYNRVNLIGKPIFQEGSVLYLVGCCRFARAADLFFKLPESVVLDITMKIESDVMVHDHNGYL